ncbi:hypothetical protein FGO68_gene605 [Halteria grandinella]|uniref:Uncharacterized protein n=1 Tax=Halteria grandinella TaxID=5974 RepID=A0A8J8T431_HALGN|nr:hypothetical protein FGO68_gene605 [Halteria grandinella]
MSALWQSSQGIRTWASPSITWQSYLYSLKQGLAKDRECKLFKLRQRLSSQYMVVQFKALNSSMQFLISLKALCLAQAQIYLQNH